MAGVEFRFLLYVINGNLSHYPALVSSQITGNAFRESVKRGDGRLDHVAIHHLDARASKFVGARTTPETYKARVPAFLVSLEHTRTGSVYRN